MKEVKLVIGGKEYAKTQPMVKDWRAMIAFQQEIGQKNIAGEMEAFDATLEYVANYLGAPAEKMEECCAAKEVFDAMRGIDANLSEAFTGAGGPKNAEGAKAPRK